MKFNRLFHVAFVSAFVFFSCSDDNDVTPNTEQQFFNKSKIDNNATVLFEATYKSTDTEGFGMNPDDILEGTVLIPEQGRRVNVSFEGTTTGILNGTIRGTDFLTRLPNGRTLVDIESVITLSNKETIGFRVIGETTPIEGSDISKVHVIGQRLELTSNYSDLTYLKQLYVVGIGTFNRSTNITNIKVYSFSTDPFNGEPPYKRDEQPPFDEEFPLTLEQVQNNPDAVLLYKNTVAPTDMAVTFGADLQALFTGNADIPEEGTRVDFGFQGNASEGTLAGGTLAGVDYLTFKPGGEIEIDAQGVFTTADGKNIALDIVGLTFYRDGETTQSVNEVLKLRSNDPTYEYLNDRYVVGIGSFDVPSNQLIVNIYSFPSAPF